MTGPEAVVDVRMLLPHGVHVVAVLVLVPDVMPVVEGDHRPARRDTGVVFYRFPVLRVLVVPVRVVVPRLGVTGVDGGGCHVHVVRRVLPGSVFGVMLLFRSVTVFYYEVETLLAEKPVPSFHGVLSVPVRMAPVA